MTYYERKAMQFLDQYLPHPWTGKEFRGLIKMIEVLVMDAEIEE